MNHKKSSGSTISRLGTREILPCILFFLSIILGILTTYHVAGNYIDADASSELVLAHQLSQTGQILSKDWFYSTELRVLNTQLVYAPLFLIFESWHMVRFFGSLILQAIMILSFAFLANAAGLRKSTFFLSAALLLLPVSVTYGRIVLYHCYYIPHISLSFFLLGLLLKFADKPNWKHPTTYCWLILLIIFSFVGGLGGIRQLMVTHAPVLLVIAVLCLLEDNDEIGKASILSKERLPLMGCAITAAAASFAGLKVNTNVLAGIYTFDKQAENRLFFADISVLDDILYGFFHQFGFRYNIPLISLEGILSLAGIFAGFVFIIIAIRKLMGHRKGMDIKKAILTTMPLFYVAIMVIVFLLVAGSYTAYPLYFTFCLSWAAPFMALHLEETPSEMHLLHSRRIFSWLAVAILFVNGFANITFFNGSKVVDQPYEGIGFQDLDVKDDMANVCTFLTENGYDIGYAPFWQGNIVTEITNGKVRINNIKLEENGNILYYDWLASLYLREVKSEKPFLLLKSFNQKTFALSDSLPYCSLVYDDSKYCVYQIPDQDAFVSLLYS